MSLGQVEKEKMKQEEQSVSFWNLIDLNFSFSVVVHVVDQD
jgi:ribosomal silencing factor RsfS